MAAVGAAVDYSRANSNRSAMQAMLDATALMLAKDAKSLSPNEIQSRAQRIFASMYTRKEVLNVQISSNYNSQTGKLTLNGIGTVKTTVANVLGLSQMTIAVMSEIVTAGANLEVVLVLDNTGSMASSGKIQALVAASKMFIRELQKASKSPGDIKVGIVPFDTRVKIGTAHNSESWIDWGGMSAKERSDWSGCVIDRDMPNDVQDAAPTNNPATRFPADKSSCGLPQILPLTTDFNLATSRLDQMKPNGSTNTTIGLVWGWHLLSPGVPMTEAVAPSSKVAKFIVFLTDGQNTKNRWTNNTRDIDRRTEIVCQNIKTARISVFTIRVKEGNADLLRRCATEPGMYYDVPAVNEMMAVFKNIAGHISRLRIAR
jgi:Mg-chelatase subunit ChlD